MRIHSLLPFSIAVALAVSPCADASPAPPTWPAAFRFRVETVDQEGFARDALASTARLRLGVSLPLSPSWRAFAEGEAVGALTDRYNSGANGRTQYPAVVDPSALEVNQAGIAWRDDRFEAIAGRQRIAFDNQRFVGNVGWRQNEQTFDAALVALKASERWSLHYGWLDRVHRVAGDRARDPLARERDLDAHLLHATFANALGPLSGYVYALEDEDLRAASTRTVGARWTLAGTRGGWRWSATLEAARQDDYADNPLRFAHAYRLVEAGAGRGSWNARAGRERLAGDGTHALQTPLATLHAFNGWADVFVVTPAAGLDDRYVALSGRWAPTAAAPFDWAIAWHDYRPTRHGARYGGEWNASVGYKLAHGWSALLKVADYRADGFGRNTRKLWLQFEWTR